MEQPSFYRAQAERARRVADTVEEPQLQRNFRHLARDFEEIAEDLESGVAEPRHRELLPQGEADC